MKKLMVMMSLYLFCSLCTIVGETEEVRFQIQADSRVHEEAGLKNQIYAVYSELTDGVDAESRPVIVAQNIKRFEVNEDIHAEYQNNTVVITQGGRQRQSDPWQLRCVQLRTPGETKILDSGTIRT